MKILISFAIATIMLTFMSNEANTFQYGKEEGMSGSSQKQDGFAKVRDGKFIDPLGREIILHGVNICEKSKARNFLSWHGPKEFAIMREWGFNCIRLGISWEAVEPIPGKYNDEYLGNIDKRIQWAKDNGIYVIIDMHQDVFGPKVGGNGAPNWATLDDGKAHIRGDGIWSMAYFTSPAVHAAFDNFWDNKPASDGVGVQDHFALTWQHIAKRYANEPTVVGYDLFNEPFSGSAILLTMPLKLRAISDAIAEKQNGKAPSMIELMQKFTKSDEFKKYADDIDLYKTFLDGGAFSSQEFENTKLASFNNRVAAAIREVDQNHIIFIETHLLCNVGVPSGVVPITNANGNGDPLQAFAPHGYDIVTDTPELANASEERVALIYERHAETARRLKLPALIGEWGAFGGNPDTFAAAQMVVNQLEKYLLSDTYWIYSSSREPSDAVYLALLIRPYPAAISGTLLSYQSDLEEGTFNCAWKENPEIAAPNRVYLSDQWFSKGYNVELEPMGDGWIFEKMDDEGQNGYLVISPIGQEIERKLTIRRK